MFVKLKLFIIFDEFKAVLIYFLFFLLSLAFVSGCSSPKDVNEQNITAAVNAAISDSLFLDMQRLPNSRPRCRNTDPQYIELRYGWDGWDIHGARWIAVNDLVDFRILTPCSRKRYSTSTSAYLFNKRNSKNIKIENHPRVTWYKFYYGKLTVKKITSWTEPSDYYGKKTITVKYHHQLTDFPEWAYNTVKHFDDNSEKTIQLVLTNKGWASQ